MTKKAPSIQAILRKRQHTEFVGRDEQLALFRQNFNHDLDDERRRFIFAVSGQGGVGKTWLLRQWQKIAEDEFAAITARTDDAEDSIPEVMGRLAEQLAEKGHPLKAFNERYKVYRQKQQELESDPDAPQGIMDPKN